VSAQPSAVFATPVAQKQATDFGRAAMAILAAMVLLIVALTGILVETTWRNPAGEVEVLPPSADPGSFARR
jgi:hydrogenase-4 membrane subunit HyfE